MRRHVWSLPLVAVYLLLAIATAHAECAWVLWQEKRPDMLAPGRDEDPVMFIRGTPQWRILEAARSHEACQESFWRWMKYAREEQKPIMKNGKPVGQWSVELQCLPDTVDPRGPKAAK